MPLSLRIVVVDDELNMRRMLALCLQADGHKVSAFGTHAEVRDALSRQVFDLAFVDLRLGNDSGLDVMDDLQANAPWTRVVVITAFAAVETAIQAMKRGASDYLSKPLSCEHVRLVTRKLAQVSQLERQVAELRENLERHSPPVDFESTCPQMLQALDQARRVALSDATVLLTGENGTGKSALARAIHEWSPRNKRPVSVVSCPSLSAELLESELFGHVRGAFTGAVRDLPGRISSCDGGTLILDEIGDLPLPIQPKLLRFLQDREFEKVGDSVTRRADVRVLAATNLDLEKAVADGRFREDLYYRLNVVGIRIPPLRERPDDVLITAERLLSFFARSNHKAFAGFTERAVLSLLRHSWPGNLRELRNAVERAVILAKGERIDIGDLPPVLAEQGGSRLPALGDAVPLSVIEEAHIRRVLATTPTLHEAACILGIDEATLWRKRKQYGIQ